MTTEKQIQTMTALLRCHLACCPCSNFSGSNTPSKFRRYESHIDRTLYKALHELQRLQAARLGQKVSAPLAIDIDVSQDGTELY